MIMKDGVTKLDFVVGFTKKLLDTLLDKGSFCVKDSVPRI